MQRRTKPLSRERSRADKDKDFLRRTLNRSGAPLSEEAAALITKLVNRYHDVVYMDINGMFHYKYAFSLEDALDNYDYILSKIKNGRYPKLDHAAMIYEAYAFDPALRCRIRTAPITVRRRAIAVIKLSLLLNEAINIPDECHDDEWYNAPSEQLIQLGVKHWKHLDRIIDMVLERDMTLGAIDTTLEDDLATSLSSGAL